MTELPAPDFTIDTEAGWAAKFLAEGHGADVLNLDGVPMTHCAAAGNHGYALLVELGYRAFDASEEV